MKKIFFLIFIFSSCVFDHLHTIARVRNSSNKNIIILFQSTDSLEDQTLFYGSKYLISTDSTQAIKVLGYNFKNIYFFIFDADSVKSSIDRRKVKGIVKNSFLEKISMSTDSLKMNNLITYK